MEEPAEQAASMNAGALTPADEQHRSGRVGWLQSRRPMRPVRVVVADVDPEHPFEMLAPHEQQPVEALGTDSPDPPLRVGVGVGCLHWCDQYLGVLRAEHIVEPTAELGVTIADPSVSTSRETLALLE
jgi:hypothetical protein